MVVVDLHLAGTLLKVVADGSALLRAELEPAPNELNALLVGCDRAEHVLKIATIVFRQLCEDRGNREERMQKRQKL